MANIVAGNWSAIYIWLRKVVTYVLLLYCGVISIGGPLASGGYTVP